MRIVTVNYYYDRHIASPDELLARYATLVDWANGLKNAGGQVTVVQRFSREKSMELDGVRYLFVVDAAVRFGSIIDRANRLNTTAAQSRPDIAHVHGLMFARQAQRLKRSIPNTPVLLQDHADSPPVRPWARMGMRTALQSCSAMSFSARSLAQPWIDAAMIDKQMPVFELMEGSSRFRFQRRDEARSATGFSGDPVCLWVGRLNGNKDPLTILRGFASALTRLPGARLLMAYGEADLLPEVHAWLAANPKAASHVTLLGYVPHADLEAIYNSADFFLLGSHHESAGYAAIEAMSCGVVPVVTAIPSFERLLSGGCCGGLWPAGDATAMAGALVDCAARWTPSTPQAIRSHFDCHWSIAAIGRSAMAAYSTLERPAIA